MQEAKAEPTTSEGSMLRLPAPSALRRNSLLPRHARAHYRVPGPVAKEADPGRLMAERISIRAAAAELGTASSGAGEHRRGHAA